MMFQYIFAVLQMKTSGFPTLCNYDLKDIKLSNHTGSSSIQEITPAAPVMTHAEL